jgi:hypothetical protein
LFTSAATARPVGPAWTVVISGAPRPIETRAARGQIANASAWSIETSADAARPVNEAFTAAWSIKSSSDTAWPVGEAFAAAWAV